MRPNTVKRSTNQPAAITSTATRKIDGRKPPMIRLPKSTKLCGRPVMVELSLTTRAAPAAMLSMPSVTMKDGIFQRVEIQPLRKPQAAPVAMQASSAKVIATAGDRLSSIMTVAPTTVQSASTEPTERSMPPVRMTKVMPAASTVLMAICTKIFSALPGVAK